LNRLIKNRFIGSKFQSKLVFESLAVNREMFELNERAYEL